MLNGYCIVEPIEENKKEYMFHVPKEYIKNELSLGKILLMGDRNSEYYDMDYIDTDDFEIGNVVLFRKHNNLIHKDYLNKEVYKIQRRQIICLIKNCKNELERKIK